MDLRIILTLYVFLLKCGHLPLNATPETGGRGGGGEAGGGDTTNNNNNSADYDLYDDDDFDVTLAPGKVHEYVAGICSHERLFKFNCNISHWNRNPIHPSSSWFTSPPPPPPPPPSQSSSSSTSSSKPTKIAIFPSKFESILNIYCNDDGGITSGGSKDVACRIDGYDDDDDDVKKSKAELDVHFYANSLIGWFKGNVSATLLSLGAALLKCDSADANKVDCAYLLLLTNSSAQGNIRCSDEPRPETNSHFIRCKFHERRLLVNKFFEVAANFTTRLDDRYQADVYIRAGALRKNYKVLAGMIASRVVFYATECHDGPDERCADVFEKLKSTFDEVDSLDVQYQVDGGEGKEEEEEEDVLVVVEVVKEEEKEIGKNLFGLLSNSTLDGLETNRTIKFHLGLQFETVTLVCDVSHGSTDGIAQCTSHDANPGMEIKILIRFAIGRNMTSIDIILLVGSQVSGPLFPTGTSISHCSLQEGEAKLTCNLTFGMESNNKTDVDEIDRKLNCNISTGGEIRFDCTMYIVSASGGGGGGGGGGDDDSGNVIPGENVTSTGEINLASKVFPRRFEVSCRIGVDSRVSLLESLAEENSCLVG